MVKTEFELHGFTKLIHRKILPLKNMIETPPERAVATPWWINDKNLSPMPLFHPPKGFNLNPTLTLNIEIIIWPNVYIFANLEILGWGRVRSLYFDQNYGLGCKTPPRMPAHKGFCRDNWAFDRCNPSGDWNPVWVAPNNLSNTTVLPFNLLWYTHTINIRMNQKKSAVKYGVNIIIKGSLVANFRYTNFGI